MKNGGKKKLEKPVKKLERALKVIIGYKGFLEARLPYYFCHIDIKKVKQICTFPAFTLDYTDII